MTSRPTDLSTQEARVLMSMLLDGELGTADADRLNRYLEANPEAIDWMETQSSLRESITPITADFSEQESIDSIVSQLPEKSPASTSKLLSFPKLVAPLAAAAALIFMTAIGWQKFNFTGSGESQLVANLSIGSEVEYVSTDIPNANPVVFTDQESGWTVVWVEQMDELPAEEA